RAAQDGEDRVPVVGVDVAVLLRVRVGRVARRNLAGDRHHQPIRERREAECPHDQEEGEYAELADPAALGRLLPSSEQPQSRRIVTWRLVGLAELTRNAVDVLPEGGLEAKLKLGRPLRVKLGIDVTSPDIHVGRAIPLQRMRAFQDDGHIGVLIVGDYTTRIGDPSGRSAERPILSDEEIDANARTYQEQAFQIIDPDRTEVRYNGEWLSKLSYADVVRLARMTTVARILERDDFANRFAAQEPISVS